MIAVEKAPKTPLMVSISPLQGCFKVDPGLSCPHQGIRNLEPGSQKNDTVLILLEQMYP